MIETFNFNSISDTTKVDYSIWQPNTEEFIIGIAGNEKKRKFFVEKESNMREKLVFDLQAEAFNMKNKPKVKIQIQKILNDFTNTDIHVFDNNNKKRIAKSNETLYCVYKTDGVKETRSIRFEGQISPKLDINNIPKSHINWKINDKELSSYIGELGFKTLIYEKKNQKIHFSAGHPTKETKTAKIEWIEQNRQVSEEKRGNEIDFKEIIENIMKIAQKLDIPITSDRNTFENKKKQSSFEFFLDSKNEYETLNKEDEKSRLVYKEEADRYSFAFGVKGEKEVPVPNFAIPPIHRSFLGHEIKLEFGLYFFIGGDVLADIGASKIQEDYIEQKDKRNITYWKYKEPAQIEVSVTIGLDPKGHFYAKK